MDYEKVGLLHEQFVRSAERTPHQVAVVSPDENLKATFEELNTWTATLATTLQRMRVWAGSPVGIFLDKSMDYVTSYIAILRAGGGYIPVDTSYPEHMLQLVLEDSQPTAVITCPELVHRIHHYPVEKVIVLEKGWQELLARENQEHHLELRNPPLTLDSLAYIVYTSGTTGRPKGIMCPHRGAVFSYYDRHTNFPYRHEVAHLPLPAAGLPADFQPYDGEEREGVNIYFVWEMLRPLLRNVTLYVIPNHTIYDPPLLCKYLKDHKITRIQFTPSLMESIITTQPKERVQESFRTARHVWFTGEVVTTSLLERMVQTLPWVRFVNMYSVSETHDVACQDLTECYIKFKDSLMARKFCPVGPIMKGVDIVIKDKDGNPQPVGKPGEIYVSGHGLALGYLNRPDVQKHRFIETTNESGKKIRLYRSGDWGYMLSDGTLEICGRMDTMVKIRGFSVEIQAVEACLLSLAMVNKCVIIVCGEEGQDKFLVAYIVSSRHTDKKEIRAELKQRLPPFMIPSYFVFLDKIPCDEYSGKLDKKALPAYDSQMLDGVGAEGRPATETEQAVAQMWMDVLRLKVVDAQESFFDLGGHSLLAIQLLEQAKAEFCVDLAVHDVFLYPTVSSLAMLIDSRLGNTMSGSLDLNHPQQQLDLHAEVEKHDQRVVNLDMQLRAFWRTFQHGHHFSRGRVLLTGATGFLGAFILRALLLNTKLVVYCLAREQPGVSMIDRVKAALVQFGILSADKGQSTTEQTQILEQFESRVIVMKGDVSLMHLGLDEPDYMCLSTDIDFIIHVAAAVNLVYPYNALHSANVTGTANVIQFATAGKIKALHHISSNAIFPHGLFNCREDADLREFPTKLTCGYAKTKWVAEQLVAKARDWGLPVAVYRPGNMSGDSKQAFWNPQDFTLLMLQACAKTGLAPALDWDMEITPVDFAADVIVKLTQNPSMALGKTMHIINDKPIKYIEAFQWMNSHGYPLKLIHYDEWKVRVVEELRAIDESGHPSADLIKQVIESCAVDAKSLPKLSTFDTSNLQKVLGEFGLLYPYTDSDLLHTYVTALSSRGLLVSSELENGHETDDVTNGTHTTIITGFDAGECMDGLPSQKYKKLQEVM